MKIMVVKGSFVVMLVAMAGLWLWAAPPPLREIDPAEGCGQTLGIPGEHYVLTGNLECSGPVHGLVITADNVVLHLAGHTISNTTCDVAHDIAGVYAVGGLTGVTIEGGRISGFNDGISLSSSNSVVRSMTVTGACYYGILVQADGNLVEKNVVSASAHGVALAPATNTRVRANDLSGNTVGLLISDNDANDNLVEDNIINGNSQQGVLLRNGTRNTVENNTVNHNQAGIMMQSAGNTVRSNNVSGTLGTGIASTSEGDPATVEDNTVLGSGGVDLAWPCGAIPWLVNLYQTFTCF